MSEIHSQVKKTTTRSDVITATDVLPVLINAAHQMAVSKGWWGPTETGPERTFGEQVVTMHGELSEAVEEFRKHGLDPSKFIYFEDGKPEGIAVEFADALIRIFDTCGRYDIPLDIALDVKMEYNATRPHKHGGKKI